MKKSIKLKAALFDLDGVVFDTEPQYTVFWGQQCRKYLPERPGMELLIKGKTLDEILNDCFGKFTECHSDIISELNAFEREMQYEYVEGFIPFIQELRLTGLKTAVVTSSNHEKMQRVLERHADFGTYFDKIFTSEDFSSSKPDPQCYNMGMEYFQVKPEETVGFEDSVNGLLAAKRSGMWVVGLTTTNPIEVVAPLSHVQIPLFDCGLTLESLTEQLTQQ